MRITNPPSSQVLLRPFKRFFQLEASSGILLLLTTIVALIWVNSPFINTYDSLWQTPFTIGYGDFLLSKPLVLWVNDGLMAIFFFVVGLEIKREILVGELSSMRQALLPIGAALGGLILPAVIYALLNPPGSIAVRGWAIPTATDIAFALGVLALLGDRVPTSLKVFLTAFAIVDDLFAILIIAIFYTASLSMESLGVGVFVFIGLMTLNRIGIQHPLPYVLFGIALWVACLKSGIHATIAGVVLAMTIPARSVLTPKDFIEEGRHVLEDIEKAGLDTSMTTFLSSKIHQERIHQLEHVLENVQTPLHKLEHDLHPWSIFLIMPVFALANAGLTLDLPSLMSSFGSNVVLGIMLGLVVGKQVGITAFTWLMVKSRLAKLPAGMTWLHVYGAACLGGIGFTMSLFIGGLSFDNPALFDQAKIGIFAASIISGVLGWWTLSRTLSVAKAPGTSPVQPAEIH